MHIPLKSDEPPFLYRLIIDSFAFPFSKGLSSSKRNHPFLYNGG